MKRMLLLLVLATVAAAVVPAQFIPGTAWATQRFHGEWMSHRGETIVQRTGAVDFDFYGNRYVEVRETVWVSTERRACGYVWFTAGSGFSSSWRYEWRCTTGFWWRYYWRYYWVRG